MPQRQLGELMMELELITEEQLAMVLEVQRESKRPLGQIIVELGFASGAAVAHALAMQSGGALRTEYGFALGLHPEDAESEGESPAGLPKLRLAPTAVVPATRPSPAPVEEPAPTLPPAEPEEVAAEAEPEPAETVAETPAAEPEVEIHEPEAGTETAVAVEAEEPAELEQLRAEIERLEAALADTQAAADERDRLLAEVERLERALTDAQESHEQNLARLREEHESSAAELEQLQAAATEHERLQAAVERLEAETERLQTALAEAEASAAEHERRLLDEQEKHSDQRAELIAGRDLLEEQLADANEQLAAVRPVAEERDRLRAEVDQFESTLAAVQAEREQELGRLRAEHERAREELDRMQTTLAEAQTSAAEHERRLAEERERHAGERSELTAQRDELVTEREELIAQRERLAEELGNALERLAVVAPAVEECDELRTKVERLETALAEVRERSAAELREVVEERDGLAAELEEARELLRQAERVRESQIALEAERDRARAELERLQTIAGETQAELEEQTRLLAEEQDRHNAERETLLAQRTRLEEELGSAIEQLAGAAAAADERDRRLQLGSQRILEALEGVRGLATELVTGGEESAEAAPTVDAEADAEAEPDPAGAAEAEPEAETAAETETEEIEYSLFVPGPNGYELVPQTGIPPQAGQMVELELPDREDPVLYEVVRSGRTLPGGDVCVYLAQV